MTAAPASVVTVEIADDECLVVLTEEVIEWSWVERALRRVIVSGDYYVLLILGDGV
jgi:hypothetical protein